MLTVARTKFGADGKLMDGPGLHGGDNFAYVRAMRQIAEETTTPVIDLFQISENKQLVELKKHLRVKKLGVQKPEGL